MPLQTKEGNLGLLLLGFVTIIIGINLLVPIANTIAGNSVINTNSNRTLTFANNSVISLVDDTLISGSETVYGGSGILLQPLNKGSSPNPNYTIDYTNGDITFINATPQDWYNNSLINVTYRFEGDNYVANATARTIENLTVIFAAIAIFVVGVFIAMT